MSRDPQFFSDDEESLSQPQPNKTLRGPTPSDPSISFLIDRIEQEEREQRQAAHTSQPYDSSQSNSSENQAEEYSQENYSAGQLPHAYQSFDLYSLPDEDLMELDDKEDMGSPPASQADSNQNYRLPPPPAPPTQATFSAPDLPPEEPLAVTQELYSSPPSLSSEHSIAADFSQGNNSANLFNKNQNKGDEIKTIFDSDSEEHWLHLSPSSQSGSN